MKSAVILKNSAERPSGPGAFPLDRALMVKQMSSWEIGEFRMSKWSENRVGSLIDASNLFTATASMGSTEYKLV